MWLPSSLRIQYHHNSIPDSFTPSQILFIFRFEILLIYCSWDSCVLAMANLLQFLEIRCVSFQRFGGFNMVSMAIAYVIDWSLFINRTEWNNNRSVVRTRIKIMQNVIGYWDKRLRLIGINIKTSKQTYVICYWLWAASSACWRRRRTLLRRRRSHQRRSTTSTWTLDTKFGQNRRTTERECRHVRRPTETTA